MDTPSQKITPPGAEKILLEVFNLTGTAFALPGEVDLNFKITIGTTATYILKIIDEKTTNSAIDFQQKILEFLYSKGTAKGSTKVILDKNGNGISTFIDANNRPIKVRLLTWISGRVFNAVNPQLDDLRFSLGEKAGLITKDLQGFEHPEAHKMFDWDLAQGLWTKDFIHLFKSEDQEIITYFQTKFEHRQDTYTCLRKSIVHNDINDHNILVSQALINPKVTAIIDFGDAIKTQTINDLAIACAYGIMRQNDPLAAALPIIKGYHTSFKLTEVELDYLYVLIGMRLVISITKSAIAKVENSTNTYLLISEQAAWELLKKWHNLSEDFAHFSFREACGFTAHPAQKNFENWALENKFYLSDLFPTVQRNEIEHIDLSVSSAWIGHEKEFNDLDLFQFKIAQLQKKVPQKIIAGGYLEPRCLYTSTAYDQLGNKGRESRAIHMGVDFWLPEYTSIHALFEGEVVVAQNDAGDKEYGGLLILKHQQKNLIFFTLYGHNTAKSVLQHELGDVLKKGEKIAELARYPENGNWAPHLHFQLLLSLLDYKVDFPGVAYFHQIAVWKSLCPNPNLLFKLDSFKENLIAHSKEISSVRKKHLGKGMTLQYQTPLHIVRGANQYLIDTFGHKYLDTVNNVAHVGHENYDVVKAGQGQMAVLNTNTRYLHENITNLAKEIKATLPKELTVLHFVNSGSEANELAIRMIRTATNSQEIIASEAGYHGNTNACIDLSSYKFDGKGGNGTPEHTHLFPIPNSFRGKYRGEKCTEKYAKEIDHVIFQIHRQGKKVAGLILEPIISCGGQVELPEGFLEDAYKKVRKAGGFCISDEVQTGCGRMGKTFWGFELHAVVPDIVTIGKPLGNGHPVAAVACTQEIADKFANGMEFFNTFGGNPVSCAIASQVLKTVKSENLQQNALEVGEFLKTELKKLAIKFPIIGDVRGQGLFLGIELVDAQIRPLAHKTTYLISRMKDFGILMSSDGPDHNVIKIKPPLTFTLENAKEVLFYLQKVLEEDFMIQI